MFERVSTANVAEVKAATRASSEHSRNAIAPAVVYAPTAEGDPTDRGDEVDPAEAYRDRQRTATDRGWRMRHQGH